MKIVTSLLLRCASPLNLSRWPRLHTSTHPKVLLGRSVWRACCVAFRDDRPLCRLARWYQQHNLPRRNGSFFTAEAAAFPGLRPGDFLFAGTPSRAKVVTNSACKHILGGTHRSTLQKNHPRSWFSDDP